jgi:hypothetical protein
MKNLIVPVRYFSPEGEFGGLFDDDVLGSAVSKSDERGGGNPDMYSPSLTDEKCKGGIWKAELRFVPFAANINITKIKKYVYYFENGQDKFYIDCTSNIDAKKRNIITEAFFYMNKHDSAQLRKLSNLFKRKIYFWSLVMINSDDQYPELAGKIKVFRYGNKINDKIIEQGAEAPGRTKVNIFNPFTGKDLYLRVEKESYQDKATGSQMEMTSYDGSYFGEARTSIMIDGKHVPPVPASQALVNDFLLKNSPDLSAYQAKPWSDEEEEKVINTVRDLIGDPRVFNEVYRKAYGKAYAGAATSDASSAENGAVKDEMAKKLANNTQSKAADAAPAKPVAETKTEPSVEVSNDLPFNDGAEIEDFNFEDLPDGD